MPTDNQASFWDKDLEEPELEAALVDWVNAKDDRSRMTVITKAKKEHFDAAVKKHRIRSGQRVRIGRAHLTVSERSVEDDVVTPAYKATTAIQIGLLDSP